MAPKWHHQDHNISTGSFSRNPEKHCKNKGIWFFCFDQHWCSSPERCQCRDRNIISLSLPCRDWDAPSLLLPSSHSIRRRFPEMLLLSWRIQKVMRAAGMFACNPDEPWSQGWRVVKLVCWPAQRGKHGREFLSEARTGHCWMRTRRAEWPINKWDGKTAWRVVEDGKMAGFVTPCLGFSKGNVQSLNDKLPAMWLISALRDVMKSLRGRRGKQIYNIFCNMCEPGVFGQTCHHPALDLLFHSCPLRGILPFTPRCPLVSIAINRALEPDGPISSPDAGKTRAQHLALYYLLLYIVHNWWLCC